MMLLASYYISSRIMSAEQVASAVREHWAIESMHWVLDVSMEEDACQIYKDHAAENLALFPLRVVDYFHPAR